MLYELREAARTGSDDSLCYLEWGGVFVDQAGEEVPANEMSDDMLDDVDDLLTNTLGAFLGVMVGARGEVLGAWDRDTRAPLPDHISARPDDLVSLIDGMVAFDRGPATALDPVIAAAGGAFGFVYIHPFDDGEGRLPRYLIHHVLAQPGMTMRAFPGGTLKLEKGATLTVEGAGGAIPVTRYVLSGIRTLPETMLLDAASQSHLELFENSEDRGRRGTLFERIDATVTLSGATWSPNAISYSGNNRTHLVRVPDRGRFELRLMDGAANPYLLQAGVLVAGLDGIANERDPGERVVLRFPRGVLVARERDVGVTARGTALGDGDEATGLDQGQRRQEHRPNEAEDGGVGANTERQRRDGDGGEQRGAREDAPAVAQIERERAHDPGTSWTLSG